MTSFHHQPEAQHPKSSAIHKDRPADYPIYWHCGHRVVRCTCPLLAQSGHRKSYGYGAVTTEITALMDRLVSVRSACGELPIDFVDKPRVFIKQVARAGISPVLFAFRGKTDSSHEREMMTLAATARRGG